MWFVCVFFCVRLVVQHVVCIIVPFGCHSQHVGRLSAAAGPVPCLLPCACHPRQCQVSCADWQVLDRHPGNLGSVPSEIYTSRLRHQEQRPVKIAPIHKDYLTFCVVTTEHVSATARCKMVSFMVPFILTTPLIP